MRHILPRVLETTFNDYTCNNNRINIKKLPPPIPTKQTTTPLLCDMSDSKERQIRIDRILEKYRRQPSSSTSKQFSRSMSCNNESTSYSAELPQLQLNSTKMMAISNEELGKKQNSGPRSVSPYALVDHSERVGTHQEKTNLFNSLLSKSNSLKTLGEYRASRIPVAGLSSVDNKSILKSNVMSSINNNDEDPPSSASSTSSNSKSVAAKEDNHHYSSVQLDWATGENCEETMSDRIRRRSFYVKLK